MVDAGFGKRFVFGSDPMYWPEAIGEAIGSIESAPFPSAEHKRDIFYDNAARFLRLTDRDRRGPSVTRGRRRGGRAGKRRDRSRAA